MLKMSKRLAGLVIAGLLVTAAAPAFGLGAVGCAPQLDGPATLVGAVVLGPDGEALAGVLPDLAGYELNVDGFGRLADGARVQVNDRIVRGYLANAGDRPVLLTFSDGQTVRLEQGAEVAVAADARCECRCTCKTATGLTKVFRFPCDGNGDDCNYNGDLCQWAGEDGVTHTGTFTGCLKVWVLPADSAPTAE